MSSLGYDHLKVVQRYSLDKSEMGPIMPSYTFFRQLLFKLESEQSHRLALLALQNLARLRLGKLVFGKPIINAVQCMGLHFPNPVGLAAGFDKNADYLDALSLLGFGFIEVGTVTPRPQAGQPQPRLFRLPHYHALINRMGFNNKGINYLIDKVGQSQYRGILGINIGKNFDTDLDNAVEDYLIGFRKAYPYANYITVNISSPNTEGLRKLQGEEYLLSLITALKKEQLQLQATYKKYVPLVVKISPDLEDEQLNYFANVAIQQKIDGIIATNTTISRKEITDPIAMEKGGLSGEPLFDLSKSIITKISAQINHQLPIIAVGGIMSSANAIAMKEAGASLIQLYTGLIYSGPQLIRETAKVF